MIFVGDCYEAEFEVKGINKIRCAIGKNFYMFLYSDNTAYYKNSSHAVCFVVPVHYLSFVRSLSTKFTLSTPVEKIFEFKSNIDKMLLEEYVRNIKDNNFSIIKELMTTKVKRSKK